MNKKIKSLLQQAELYRKQGLLSEAKKRYNQVETLIQNSDQIPNKEKLLTSLSKKVQQLDKEAQTVKNAPSTPEMSSHVNELIKKLFSFSSKDKDENDAALEGAIALAKFGQFEGAINEFKNLLQVSSQRLSAAKNILRCHLELGSTDKATQQLSEWQSGDIFSEEQIEKVSLFFDDIIKKKGLKKDEAPVEEEEDDVVDVQEEDDEEFLDISAVAITFDSGPFKGEQIELDVSFQSGNIISLIISSKDEKLIENLKVGCRLDDVHFYSPVAIFRGSGVVSAQTQIKSGPKKGDFSLDITIESL